MLDTLSHLITFIGNETGQQSALNIIVFGSVGLGIVGLVIRLVSKVKAAAFLGG